MQCFRKCALAVLAMAVACVATAAALAWTAADFLAASDEPAPADAIVVLGHDPSRVFQAADAFRDGLAPRVVLSRPVRAPRNVFLESQGIAYPWFETTGRAILVARGVPEAAIEVLPESVISTATEAVAFGRALPDARRLLVVTSPYHVFRTRLIFNRELPDRDIRVVASRYEALPRHWWREQETAILVLMEFVKLPFYAVGGRL